MQPAQPKRQHFILLLMPRDIEHKSKRTLYSKTYWVDKTTKCLIVSLEQLHYEKDGKLTEIDTRPKETDKGWIVQTPYYKCEVIKFPFEIKAEGHSIKNLDSPDLNFPEIETYLYFPRSDIRVNFRAEGIDIEGEGTWKINGEVKQEKSITYNFAPVLSAETPGKYLQVTGTQVPGEIQSQTLSGHLEIIYTHNQQWWKQLKRELKA